MSKPTQLLQQAVKELEAGRPAEAVALCERVIEREPGNTLALNFLALVEHQRGRNEQALSWIQRAIKISPSNVEAHRSAGTILLALGKFGEAAEATRKAAALQPDLPGVHAQLGKALTMLERGDEAMASLEIALRQDPHPNADLLNTVAAALEQCCDFVRAEEFARRALLLQPNFKDAFMSLGNALSAQGRLGEALQAYDQALALKGDDAMTRYNRSLVLLASGDFLRGWAEYEWRWSMPIAPAKLPKFKQPAWDGGDIRGQTILLYSEQGAGDVFHFIRYVPLLAARGARVLLVCPIALHSLVRHVQGLEQVIALGEPIPPFDTHAALMSLPCLLKTTLENLPASVPYLPIPSAETFPLSAGPGGSLKVGLVWSGGGHYRRNRIRSTSLDSFLPLLRMPGIRFFSLQCGPPSADLKKLPADVHVEDIGSRVRDFADTAAAMGQMDLVISVCTSTLHLAGALACPVWGVLSYAPCWRWMFGRSDSPWYPTMTLFRQPKPGDWAGVIAQIEVALRGLTQRTNQSPDGNTRANSPDSGFNHVARPGVPGSSPLYYAGKPGSGFGWGVCNRHLQAELSKLVEVRNLDSGDPMFQSKALPGDLFTPLQGSALTPYSNARGRHNLGYIFFESELTSESVESAHGFELVPGTSAGERHFTRRAVDSRRGRDGVSSASGRKRRAFRAFFRREIRAAQGPGPCAAGFFRPQPEISRHGIIDSLAQPVAGLDGDDEGISAYSVRNVRSQLGGADGTYLSPQRDRPEESADDAKLVAGTDGPSLSPVRPRTVPQSLRGRDQSGSHGIHGLRETRDCHRCHRT
jgi:tetratricopeptide (TPR) repeat protein